MRQEVPGGGGETQTAADAQTAVGVALVQADSFFRKNERSLKIEAFWYTDRAASSGGQGKNELQAEVPANVSPGRRRTVSARQTTGDATTVRRGPGFFGVVMTASPAGDHFKQDGFYFQVGGLC